MASRRRIVAAGDEARRRIERFDAISKAGQARAVGIGAANPVVTIEARSFSPLVAVTEISAASECLIAFVIASEGA